MKIEMSKELQFRRDLAKIAEDATPVLEEAIGPRQRESKRDGI